MRPSTRQVVHEAGDPDEEQEKQEHEVEHQQRVQGHQLHRARTTCSTITRVHPRTSKPVASTTTSSPLTSSRVSTFDVFPSIARVEPLTRPAARLREKGSSSDLRARQSAIFYSHEIVLRLLVSHKWNFMSFVIFVYQYQGKNIYMQKKIRRRIRMENICFSFDYVDVDICAAKIDFSDVRCLCTRRNAASAAESN